MIITPLRDQILIKLVEFEEVTTTVGGIILAEAEIRPPKTVVDKFGNDVSIYDLMPGDAVLLRSGAGYPISDEDTNYKLVTAEDILAKIEE